MKAYQYIQKEYANNFLQGNYQHTNIHLDILFNSPVIILPLNIFEYLHYYLTDSSEKLEGLI